jgi:hypothetical protein
VTQSSAWSGPDVTTCEAAKQFWLSNPSVPWEALRLEIVPGISTSVAIQIPPLLALTLTEQMRIDNPLGIASPIVQRGTLTAPTYPLTFTITDPADYQTWLNLFALQIPLFLRDDTGNLDLIVVGPTTTDSTLTYVSTGNAPPPTWVPHAITVACTSLGSSIPPQTAVSNPPPPGPGLIVWTTLANPPNAALNTPYSAVFAATNATNFAISAGELPAGVTLSSGGTLSGTPTTSTEYGFSIVASNDYYSSAAVPFTLDVTTPYSYSPGGTYTTWTFPEAAGYTSVGWTFQPVQDAPASLTTSTPGGPWSDFLHYYAMEFSVENGGYSGAGGGGYAGFQTNGDFNGTAEGKVINFSIWGSTGGNTTNENTLINAQNAEDGGYQLMLPYNWTVGHHYAFSLDIGPGGVTSAGTWWGLTVIDENSTGDDGGALSTYVGEMLFPNTISGLPSASLQGSLLMFGEDTHWHQSLTGETIYTSPSDFQNSAMACLGVTANTGSSGSQYTSGYGSTYSGGTGSTAVTASSITYSTDTGQTSVGSNGFQTTNAKVTEYINYTTMAVQHNLGYWATLPPNTAVTGQLVY